MRVNRYDPKTETLRLSWAQAAAFRNLVPYYSAFFSDPKSEHGLKPDAITDPMQLRQLAAFFAWTAWAASAKRPGHDYSYTTIQTLVGAASQHYRAEITSFFGFDLARLFPWDGTTEQTRQPY